jgi:chromosome segregation ATPase
MEKKMTSTPVEKRRANHELANKIKLKLFGDDPQYNQTTVELAVFVELLNTLCDQSYVDCNQLRSKLSIVTADRDRLQTQLTTTNDQFRDINDHNTDLCSKINELNSKLDKVTTEMNDTKKVSANLDARLTELKNDRNESIAAVTRLQDQIATANIDRDNAIANLNRLRQETNAAIANSQRQLNADLNTLRSQCTAEIEKSRQDADSVIAQLNAKGAAQESSFGDTFKYLHTRLALVQSSAASEMKEADFKATAARIVLKAATTEKKAKMKLSKKSMKSEEQKEEKKEEKSTTTAQKKKTIAPVNLPPSVVELSRSKALKLAVAGAQEKKSTKLSSLLRGIRGPRV